ncbi:hypothetical protein K3495_g10906 [Podosphaera aphanis]|nr:hypothetical protein K3495_g10906 [Podosphaera aphanis]
MSDSEDLLKQWRSKLIGKMIVESAEVKSTTNVEVFAKTDLPHGTRVIRPGQPVTLDFRPDRLNVNIDDQDIVEGVGFY